MRLVSSAAQPPSFTRVHYIMLLVLLHSQHRNINNARGHERKNRNWLYFCIVASAGRTSLRNSGRRMKAVRPQIFPCSVG